MELLASAWLCLCVVKQSTGSLCDLPHAEGRMDTTRCSQEQAGQNVEGIGRERFHPSEGVVGNEAVLRWPGGNGQEAGGQCALPQAAGAVSGVVSLLPFLLLQVPKNPTDV